MNWICRLGSYFMRGTINQSDPGRPSRPNVQSAPAGQKEHSPATATCLWVTSLYSDAFLSFFTCHFSVPQFHISLSQFSPKNPTPWLFLRDQRWSHTSHKQLRLLNLHRHSTITLAGDLHRGSSVLPCTDWPLSSQPNSLPQPTHSTAPVQVTYTPTLHSLYYTTQYYTTHCTTQYYTSQYYTTHCTALYHAAHYTVHCIEQHIIARHVTALNIALA